MKQLSILKYVIYQKTIYARCWDGKVKCHVQDITPDKGDSKIIPCPEVSKHSRKLQVVKSAQPWPERTMCYYPIDPILFQDTERDLINRAMNDYRGKTNLRFIPIGECSGTACGSCKNGIKFIKDAENCYSSLGYQNKPIQVVSLASQCFGDGAFVPLHELGHAVGLFHEHTHPDRNVIILADGIAENQSPLDYVINSSPSTQLEPYDIDSVMHYPLDGVRLCIPTGDPKEYCDLGQDPLNCKVPTRNDCDEEASAAMHGRIGPDGKGLSRGDVAALEKLYKQKLDFPTQNGVLRLEKTAVDTNGVRHTIELVKIN